MPGNNTTTELITELRQASHDDETYTQGSGNSELLAEAADKLEQLHGEYMDIKYIWPTDGRNPNEVNSLFLKHRAGEPLPREGEMVRFNVAISDNENVTKTGKVTEVVWDISESAMVTIWLGR